MESLHLTHFKLIVYDFFSIFDGVEEWQERGKGVQREYVEIYLKIVYLQLYKVLPSAVLCSEIKMCREMKKKCQNWFSRSVTKHVLAAVRVRVQHFYVNGVLCGLKNWLAVKFIYKFLLTIKVVRRLQVFISNGDILQLL